MQDIKSHCFILCRIRYGSNYHNSQTATSLRYIIKELGHPQSATAIKTDNSTADSFVHDNITQRNLNPRTCVTTGCVKIQNRNSSMFYGNKGKKTFSLLYQSSSSKTSSRNKMQICSR